MNEVMNIIKDFRENPCACGVKHDTTIQDIEVGSGLVHKVGEILKKNNFPTDLLFVADKNTRLAAAGIEESLKEAGFNLTYRLYDDYRVADMKDVVEIEETIKGKDIGVIGVGTGSIHDPCRLAAGRQDKKLCLFGTAPSMDGFASYSSPIVNNGFKSSYPAKSPEVIIGDTKILAAAPVELKSAGFGDMVSKYVALIDWNISRILIDEYYCPKVADLTRHAIDILMGMADKVTVNDEETAGKIFEALLMTGIGMSFTQNSRPASGSEHIVAHVIDCKEIAEGVMPQFHGVDVGICTLKMLKKYNELAELESIETEKENVDWDDVYNYYGPLADDVRKLNNPTITDKVDPEKLKALWPQIREIIHSVPSYEECLEAMKKAGCKTDISEVGYSQEFYDDCEKYSPFMRYRMTLLRLLPMIKNAK